MTILNRSVLLSAEPVVESEDAGDAGPGNGVFLRCWAMLGVAVLSDVEHRPVGRTDEEPADAPRLRG